MTPLFRHHNKRVRRPSISPAPLVFTLAVLLVPHFAAAQSKPAAQSPAKPMTDAQKDAAALKADEARIAAKKAAEKKAAEARALAAQEAREHRYSPALAREDVSVAKFYRNKAKYDAAISRFRSATNHDPRWPVPYELLGEVYEKKNDPGHAVAAYREYLKLAPHAHNAKDIEKRIEKLSNDRKRRATSER